MINIKYFAHFALVAGTCLALAGCSDERDYVATYPAAPPSNVPDPGPGDDPGYIPGDDPGDDPIDEPKVEPDDGWKMLMVPAMATDVEMAQRSTVKLRVLIHSIEQENLGEAVAGQKVKWTVTSGEDLVKTKVAQSYTMKDGIAEVVLTAMEIDGDATIVASSTNSPKDVRFNISVMPLPTGTMTATLSYGGFANPQNYKIMLYDNQDLACDDFDPQFPPDKDPIASQEGRNAYFLDLATDARYTLVAYGYGSNGAIVASGCTENGLKVYPEQNTEAYLSLQTVDLDPVSTYHVRSYFDFGDIVQSLGSVGKMIATITNFTANPGATMYDLLWNGVIVTALDSALPWWVAGGIGKVLEWTGIDTTVQNYLNNLVMSNQTGCKIGLFGCQLRNIVRTMELTGDLDIQKSSALELNGHNAYSGLSVYWRIGCENNPDPNCNRLHYSMDELELGTQVNVLEGSWRGSLSNGYDRIAIESHDLSMYYGKLITYLITHVLLPRIANNATNFDDAIKYWINCTSMATWLSTNLKLTVPSWVPRLVLGLYEPWCFPCLL